MSHKTTSQTLHAVTSKASNTANKLVPDVVTNAFNRQFMRLFNSLRGQLIGVFVLVLTLGLGSLLIVAGTQISSTTIEAFQHEQQVVGLVMANSITEPMQFGRFQQVQSWLTMQTQQLTYSGQSDTKLSVYDPKGALVATNITTTATQQNPADQLPQQFSAEFGQAYAGTLVSTVVDDRLHLIIPIVHDGHLVLGALWLDTSVNPLDVRLHTRWLVLILGALGTLVLTVLAALWLSTRLTQPLSEIRVVAKRMADGHLDARAKVVTSPQELALLGTAFNHMAEQIEEMMAKQQEFVANASHELRSPLAAIKLRAEALADNVVSGERARQYAAEINEETSQLADLVSDLLELSRAESGSFTPPTDALNISDELSAYVRTIQPHMAQKHQQFEITLPEELPDLYIYPNDLRIMVSNLLDNAVKYTPNGGQINLKATWEASALSIQVCDTGEGIPHEDLPRVSERFFRVDRAHTRSTPGLGLGLALVVAAARHYNGTLTLESDGIAGKGTCACVRLYPDQARS